MCGNDLVLKEKSGLRVKSLTFIFLFVVNSKKKVLFRKIKCISISPMQGSVQVQPSCKIKCVSNPQLFSKPPNVFATSVHTTAQNKHDATSVWVEDITNIGFKACLRELKNFDGLHKDVRVVGELE